MIGKVTLREAFNDDAAEEVVLEKLAQITAKGKHKLTAEQVWNMLTLRFVHLWDPKAVLELYNTKEYRILLVEGARDDRRREVRKLFFEHMRSKNGA